MPTTFRKDLDAAGIPYLDELGRRVDFHSLRHTFNTMLQRTGVPSRIVMELMRHSDLRLSSTTYTDTTCLPLFEEIGKLDSFLPSPIASPKSDISGPKTGKPVQSDQAPKTEKTAIFRGEKPILAVAVQTWENGKMAEREGFEPSVAFRLHVISNHAHSTTLPPLRVPGRPFFDGRH